MRTNTFMPKTKLKNDLLLRVARGEAVSRPPVWMMRQAGRFLTEYREVRKEAGSFRRMIAEPAYAAEVTLQPVELVGVDAAIIFSDILVIPEALGLPYEMIPGKGPFFPDTVRTEGELAKLHPVESESNLDHTYEALRQVKQRLEDRVPLIGFAGAPWTIFCYMTEGQGSRTFAVAKSLLYRSPAFAHTLLQTITDATITYLKEQVRQGADLVQVFDSWAGILNRSLFQEFALPYLRQICDAIDEVPVTAFAKGAFYALDLIHELDCQVVGLDWQTDPAWAARQLPGKVLQGNLDPCQLYASPEEVARATRSMLAAFPAGRHIANLGHGIQPDTPRESAIAFINTVKEFSY